MAGIAFYLAAGLSLLVAFAGFLALGDVGQWVIAPPRAFVYRVFRARIPLMVLGLGAFGAALSLGIAERLAPGWALGLYGVLFAGLFFVGFVGTTYVMVYGVVRDGEAVAFTLDHLRRHGGAVTDRVGGSPITVKHFPDFGFVDVFEGDVREVDARGLLPGGTRARRVPHASRVLWLIWANFYRESGVRT